MVFNPIGHHWKKDQLLEWQERLGHVPEDTVKKTFLATTQLVPSVQHENELFPKNQHAALYPILKHRRLAEEAYMDVIELKLRGSARVKQYGLMIYLKKSKVLAYYWTPRGKKPDSLQTLTWLYEFLRDHGAPHTIITDGASELTKTKKWKVVGANLGIQMRDAGNKKESNTVERAWQTIQQRHDYLMNASTAPDDCQHDSVKHLCDLHNHTANQSLGWRTPMEVISGDTPDISMFRFRFYEPVWYRDTPNVTFKQQSWVKGRFLGIAWTTGDAMTYMVVPDGENVYHRKVARSVVLPRSPGENAPKEKHRLPSDYFFPTPKPSTAQVVGSRKRKDRIEITTPAVQPGQVAPEDEEEEDEMIKDNDGVEVGPTEVRLRKEYLDAAKAYKEVLDKEATPDGAVDVIQVQIKGHSFKGKVKEPGKLMFHTVDEQGNKLKVALAELRIDAPLTMAKYIKSSKSLRAIPQLKQEADKIIKLSDQVLRATQAIENKLGLSVPDGERTEGVKIRRTPVGIKATKTKKKKKRTKNSTMGSYKYGVYVPRSVKEALQIDKDNGNDLWKEAIIKEIKGLMDMKTFRIMSKAEKQNLDKYQFAPLQGIFDVKSDGRRKYRLCLGTFVTHKPESGIQSAHLSFSCCA